MAVGLIFLNKTEKTIGTLEDGQIAVIIDDRHFGEIVQRYGNNCVAIGKKYGHGWSSCVGNSIRVRVLEEGETIKILNNE